MSKPRDTAAKEKTTTTKGTRKAAPGGSSSSGSTTTKRTEVKRTTGGGTSTASAAEIRNLNEQISQLQLTVSGLERERDFYFGKLREVEVMCQMNPEEDKEIKETVLGILYKTDEDDVAEGEGGGGEGGEEEGGEEEEEDVTF